MEIIFTRRAVLSLAAAPLLRSASLPDQSTALLLDRAVPDPRVSYLLLDAASNRVIASRWDHPESPSPVGSLVKPFTALAYAETHAFQFPVFDCDPAACWLPQGHGRLDLAHALAHSCNSYFLQLARDVNPAAIEAVAQRFAINPPDPASTPSALIGLGATWRIAPQVIALAYSELPRRSSEPGVSEILAGLLLSAKSGTGRAVGKGAYVKTGTAACIHEPREKGDGYVAAIFPAGTPRYTLLTRVDGVPGATAAITAGRIRTVLR